MIYFTIIYYNILANLILLSSCNYACNNIVFDCKVVSKGRRSCYGGQGSRVLDAPSGLLSSVLTSETGCGRHSHPWLITSGE